PHALAHAAHLLAQAFAPHVVTQHVQAYRLEARAQLIRAGHGARMQQRLVLPGPGILALVVGERLDAGDQQASLAARAQPHVDLVETAGGGVHGEEVHDALRQAYEKQLVVDRLGAARLLALAARVVQEHQVQVRGIAELHAAELAVADGADAHVAHDRAVIAPRRAELRADLPPAERHGALDDELGEVGESVAHLHERQHARDVGDRHPEQGGALELAQRLHLLLRIVLAQLLETLLELGGAAGAGRQLRQQPLVDQLIEQQRIRGDLRRQELAVPAHLHESGARRSVLLQQRKVRRALARGLDDGEHAPQYRQLRLHPRHVGEQRRQQRLQALAARLIEPPHQARGAQLEQQARHFGAVGETGGLQRIPERGGLGLAVPEASQVDAHRAGLGTAAGKHHLAEVPADAGALCLERGAQRVPVAVPHGAGDALARQRAGGQAVYLPVLEHLQAVLEPAQEHVRRGELGHGLPRQQPRLAQAGERGEERRRLQAAVAAAARQLQRLHDELDLADAARAELDVVGQLAPFHLALDERLHLPEALEHAVVEVAAVDERTDGGGLDLGVALGGGHRARLDVGVALPVAAVARQVVLEGGEARHQRAGVAEGAQPQVHAQHEAIRGRRLEQPHQRLAEAREELLVGDAARAVGVAVLGEQQHEVDVGGEVELAPAELAHADDHERL